MENPSLADNLQIRNPLEFVEDLDDCLDNGYFEDDNSNYQLFITHSY